MGSTPPAEKEAAPEANRRLKSTTKSDTLASRADEILRGMRKEDVNIFDILISHLLDEGYADDVTNAYVILENMSEEWVLEILDEAKWGKQPLPDKRMTDKARKLGNKWLNTSELELGSPESKKLLSRRSAILYQRDMNAIK